MNDDGTPADAGRRRWPARVYGGGVEPDPRFSLANERTFLAWIRTALALLGASAVVDLLELDMADVLQSIIAAVLAVASLACAAQAWRGWSRAEAAMREGRPLPSPSSTAAPVALAIVAIGIILVVVAFTEST